MSVGHADPGTVTSGEADIPAGTVASGAAGTRADVSDGSAAAGADISVDTFDSAVLRADVPVLVDFWAPSCAPCILVGPILAQLETELAGRLRVVRVNVDDNVGIATAHSIFSIPTLVLFREGREVERIVGFRQKEELGSRLRPHLAE